MIVTPLPWRGGVQEDARDGGRALRVAPHPVQGLVSLSLWQDDACIATHQMSGADVPELIRLLAESLVVLAEGEARAVS
jgi:hypothetical protein